MIYNDILHSFPLQYGSKRFLRKALLKSIEGDKMEEIEKLVVQCEKANIPADDPDLEYARRKLEVLTIRKGTNSSLYSAV